MSSLHSHLTTTIRDYQFPHSHIKSSRLLWWFELWTTPSFIYGKYLIDISPSCRMIYFYIILYYVCISIRSIKSQTLASLQTRLMCVRYDMRGHQSYQICAWCIALELVQNNWFCLVQTLPSPSLPTTNTDTQNIKTLKSERWKL